MAHFRIGTKTNEMSNAEQVEAAQCDTRQQVQQPIIKEKEAEPVDPLYGHQPVL